MRRKTLVPPPRRTAALMALTLPTISRAAGTSTGAPGSMKPFCRSMTTCAVRARSIASNMFSAPPRWARAKARASGEIWILCIGLPLIASAELTPPGAAAQDAREDFKERSTWPTTTASPGWKPPSTFCRGRSCSSGMSTRSAGCSTPTATSWTRVSTTRWWTCSPRTASCGSWAACSRAGRACAGSTASGCAPRSRARTARPTACCATTCSRRT